MPEQSVTRVEVEGRVLKLTSLGKLLYPSTETTKGEVLNYYATVAPILLPHIAARPVTRVRWPHGVAGDSFFEKNVPSGAPSWLQRVRIDDVTYPLVPDVATLTYLVNLNSLELHVPQWTVDDDGERQHPDRLVIDLDPGKPADLHECCQVALHLRERLDALGLELFPVTSGSKGMQLYAALGGDLTSDQVRDLAQQLAQEMTKKFPELVLWRMTRSLRPGKIFLDWSQNVAAKTTISPYSLRGRELPCAAAPRTWDEVEAGAAERDGISQVMLEDMLDRIAPGGIDEGGQLLAHLPWRRLPSSAQPGSAQVGIAHEHSHLQP